MVTTRSSGRRPSSILIFSRSVCDTDSWLKVSRSTDEPPGMTSAFRLPLVEFPQRRWRHVRSGRSYDHSASFPVHRKLARQCVVQIS